MGRSTHAVVLGGGHAGMLAATALARHVAAVTVVDRDRLPLDSPAPRKGVPQARHLHVLMSGGARAVDALLPGTIDRLRERGAHRLGVPEDVVTLSADGWQHRFPETQFMITATRDLTDWVVRDQALRQERVRLLQGSEARELLGGPDQVTGVRVATVVEGRETVRDLSADLVVDCTGRASRLRQWLATLGVPAVPEEVVDSGLAYATRLYEAPPGARDRFPVVNVFSDYRAPVPGRSASLVPVEGGRWMISLTGTRGGRPPRREEEFDDFARSLRSPLIARLMATARPLTGVQGSSTAANRRFYCERAAWPGGLVVLGDALVAFNPVYGTGMSAAACAALALAEVLGDGGLGETTARRAQRAIGAVVDDPWVMATSQDICYPEVRTTVVDPRLTRRTPEEDRSAQYFGKLALRHPEINAALTDVITLNAPMSRLGAPRVVAALGGAGALPELTGPPLRPAERALLDGARTPAPG
ncbi:enterotoxin [Streptomyces sp. DH-12]|uniref:FAD-dependent oxidoreductase n=1 Tax=Streptomyces sp. DH-12 TaxID=2072509 RepID=UPI000CCE04D0|nr:FAD-dependent monooxygenase [Streptomyces sp. DH-12]PNV30997.1 enterotoxin [Streptomyces sp. DH-12]